MKRSGSSKQKSLLDPLASRARPSRNGSRHRTRTAEAPGTQGAQRPNRRSAAAVFLPAQRLPSIHRE
eukprot:4220348-Prymnesium_polylepis.1